MTLRRAENKLRTYWAEFPLSGRFVMLLRAGLLAEIEGDWCIHVVEPVGHRRDVVRIGKHVYTDHGDPMTPGAPPVLEAVDAGSGWKLHKKAAKPILQRFLAQRTQLAERRERDRLLASAHGWKYERPLDAFPRERFLRFACTACTRVRLEQIGRLCGEARLGKFTVADIEAGERCLGCGRPVRIDMEPAR